MGTFEARAGEGALSGSLAIDLRDELLLVVLDKPFGREETQEVTRERVSLHASAFDYAGASELLRTIPGGTGARAPEPTVPEPDDGGPEATALDGTPADALALLEGLTVDITTDAVTQVLRVAVTLPDGREVIYEGTGVPPPDAARSGTPPAAGGPEATALDGAEGGTSAPDGDEVVADTGRPPGLRWQLRATASTDPDSSEQESDAVAVKNVAALVNVEGGFAATAVNVGVFVYNHQNVETNAGAPLPGGPVAGPTPPGVPTP